ncbi:MAG: hypothetical protein ACT4PT_06495 [Methanobacteriota archaeon]
MMADDLVVDHIVPPTELRDELIRRLEAASGKEMPLPRKKHGTVF